MTTIAQSPRELAGLPDPVRRGIRVGDRLPVAVGDLVVDQADERHVGEVRAIVASHYAVVHWLDTGWRSVVRIAKLRKVAR